jgi:hypothetical protein
MIPRLIKGNHLLTNNDCRNLDNENPRYLVVAGI